MDNNVVFELRGISKKFGNNVVLNNVSFNIKKGEIHALLGENGAGKSTILNIMSGALKMDAGELFKEGKPVDFPTPLAAKKAGIIKVHQELQVIPELTVAENIFLGNELLHPVSRIIWYKKMEEEANEVLKKLDADFDALRVVRSLSTAQKQLVEISKAILNEFSVLILDEPTSSLTNKEIVKLFSTVKKLKEQGRSFIFVSHRMPEVFEIADRVTVLKDGVCMDTMEIKDANNKKLVKLMTGRDLDNVIKNPCTSKTSEVVLAVKGLCGAHGEFKNISFELHRGEIIGFAGLVGSGRTEIMRAIFGADKKSQGEIYLHGNKVDIRSPKDSLKYKIALIPEDRRLQGMVGILPNKDNVSLSSFGKLIKRGLLTDSAIDKNGIRFMEILGVSPMNPKLATKYLSGGNQQKVVIGKWLSTEAEIIIMDEPTRGIDVGAKDEIYKLMLSLVQQGKSIIMISSELPEILNLSDRIFVMHEGALCHETSAKGQTEESILHYAMGGK